MPPRLILGCMTGTSLDALDCALLEIHGRGLNLNARLLATHSAPLADLAPRLRPLAEQHPTTAADIARLSRDFALFHSRTIRELLANSAHASADLICVHGQTVFHSPPLSWQLFNAPILAHELATPVVFDLRAADLAAGGQGAPITPIADWLLFRRHHDPMAVINLGGFCNYTAWFTDLSPNEDFPQNGCESLDIRGGDICACNQILDAIARRRMNQPYDQDGRAASAGVQHDAAFASLRELLGAQAKGNRSLGTGDELAAWIDRFAHIPAPDLLRSACEAIADTICSHKNLGGGLAPIAIAGGGARNAALVGAIRARMPLVRSSTDLGIPIEFREAACFAVLGALCQDQVPITLPSVTGVPNPAPLSGSWAFSGPLPRGRG